MIRFIPGLLLLLASPALAEACGFIESASVSPTLRAEADRSKFVLVGRMENARESPDGDSTDFVVTQVLKADPAVKVGDVIRLPRFVNIPKESPDYLVFGDITKGKPDI